MWAQVLEQAAKAFEEQILVQPFIQLICRNQLPSLQFNCFRKSDQLIIQQQLSFLKYAAEHTKAPYLQALYAGYIEHITAEITYNNSVFKSLKVSPTYSVELVKDYCKVFEKMPANDAIVLGSTTPCAIIWNLLGNEILKHSQTNLHRYHVFAQMIRTTDQHQQLSEAISLIEIQYPNLINDFLESFRISLACEVNLFASFSDSLPIELLKSLQQPESEFDNKAYLL